MQPHRDHKGDAATTLTLPHCLFLCFLFLPPFPFPHLPWRSFKSPSKVGWTDLGMDPHRTAMACVAPCLGLKLQSFHLPCNPAPDNEILPCVTSLRQLQQQQPQPSALPQHWWHWHLEWAWCEQIQVTSSENFARIGGGPPDAAPFSCANSAASTVSSISSPSSSCSCSSCS